MIILVLEMKQFLCDTVIKINVKSVCACNVNPKWEKVIEINNKKKSGKYKEIIISELLVFLLNFLLVWVYVFNVI